MAQSEKNTQRNVFQGLLDVVRMSLQCSHEAICQIIKSEMIGMLPDEELGQ